MPVYRLKPTCKNYIWGGTKLKTEWGYSFDQDILAEAWIFSAHEDGPSYFDGGKHNGQTLYDYFENTDYIPAGDNCEKFDEFPVLIKILNSAKDLSVQVHPNDEYAMKHEHQLGKTEAVYILDAEEDAKIYFGFKREVTEEEVRKSIEEGTITDILQDYRVKKGDTFFVEAGTVHAYGKGIVAFEVQQSSNVTYRLYDYGRLGADGRPRDLHVDKALDVLTLGPGKTDYDFGEHIAKCPYFTLDLIEGNYEGEADSGSYASLVCIEGEGKITCGDKVVNVKKGDSYFIPAHCGKYSITGTVKILKTYTE